MVRLIPRDTKFFDMFAEMASNLGDGARLLKQTLEDFQRRRRPRPAAQGH